MNDTKKQTQPEPPSLEDLFVISVQSALECANELKLTKEQFMKMLNTAWSIDQEQRKETRSEEKS